MERVAAFPVMHAFISLRNDVAAAPAMIEGAGGRPEPRQEARDKVTGAPIYAADLPIDKPTYGFLVTSSIARGRIHCMQLDAAKALPGVLDILAHETVDPIPALKAFMQGGQSLTEVAPLEDSTIHYAGQIIGLVVAETFEAAREASFLVEVEYDTEIAAASFDSPTADFRRLEDADPDHQDTNVGDAAAGLAAATAVIDRRYSTPVQHANPIELHSTTAAWTDGDLLIHEPSQYFYAVREAAALQLQIPREKVRVRAPFVGGAFGCKGMVTQRTALAALAARRLGRPVRVVATRSQSFTTTTHRLRRASMCGLVPIPQAKLPDTTTMCGSCLLVPTYTQNGGVEGACCMYGPENISNTSWLVQADRNTPGFMRNPHGFTVLFALESAMDELAIELHIDPVAMRKRNDAQANPISGIPFTGRSLNRCLDAAAERFGWSKRTPQPGSMRDSDWLIGWGCASCFYPTHMMPTAGRLTVAADGRTLFETAMADVGQGSATILGQILQQPVAAYLARALDVVGPQRLLFATDYPFQFAGGGGARRFIMEASISQETKIAFAYRNWERLSGGS